MAEMGLGTPQQRASPCAAPFPGSFYEHMLPSLPIAHEFKATGNLLFNRNMYSEALDTYRDDTQLCTSADIPSVLLPLLSNAGAAALALHQPEVAAGACTRALELDPGHVKARYRGAQAMLQMGLPALALSDLRVLTYSIF